ncbi:MAG: VPS10 domain-containing protein [Acidobacteriota bacterium]
MKIKKVFAFILSLLFFTFSLSMAQSAEEVGDIFESLSWRNIGPAVMGGRTVDIEAVEDKPWIIYAAIGPSGVWKSTNDGITWEPVFHKESTVSVGDIAVDQRNPDVIWVGTGEATSRNSVTIGDGIYKSTDGGKTWEHLGLEETRHISRIIIDRKNPDTVYVSALGHLWGKNKERGIYKTTDGGKNWKKILYVNENTGMADLVIDPSDSRILYAAAWDYQRYPYYFYSGGDGSGIYKTEDAGKTWKRLVKDLPEGIIGRIGLAVSQSRPNVVYALIEHNEGGIWRSEDKGDSWERMCDNDTYVKINNRPFYYSQIRVDPTDDEVVYVFSGGLFVSKDRGQRFKAISSGIHPDHHALWIDPNNPQHLIDGNDGGIDITYDQGANWRAVKHMALAEVYQIGYDMRDPYYVYCGLQDNGVWGGLSNSLDTGGIINDDWFSVGGGDGFYCEVDPTDYNVVYANSQMNGLYRYNLKIDRSKDIKPKAALDEPPYRFNWNSPVLISPHDPHTIYTGGNYLFKSQDQGHSWEIVSPDLSTNDPDKLKDSGGLITLDNTGAEVHCTLYTIAESPLEQGVIWCGTDDGNVQITRNGGKIWENVVENIPDLPPGTWCTRIEASHFDVGTAYAAFDGHRSDDCSTYLYKTTDFGETWISIKQDLPFGWIHVVREDFRNKNLLFVGMEFGIYASLDGGESWFSLNNNLPTVAVRDIAVHPRDNDLVIGTHGRGIWILDNICFLQEMTEEILNKPYHIFSVLPTTKNFISTRGGSYSGPVYAGENPEYGLNIQVYFKEKPTGRNKIFIKNKEGEELYQIRVFNKKGVYRYLWNLQFTPRTEEGEPVKTGGLGVVSPPQVAPGKYEVELSVEDEIIKQRSEVKPDPRFEIGEEERALKIEKQVEAMNLSRKMSLAVTGVKSIRRQLDKLKENEEMGSFPEKAEKAIQVYEEKFSALEEDIIPKGIGYRGSLEYALRGGSISQMTLMLTLSIGKYPSQPTETDIFMLEQLTQAVKKLVTRMNALIDKNIPDLNKVLEENEIKTIRAPKKIEF